MFIIIDLMVTAIATEEGKVVWRETNSGSTRRTKILALFMADENDPATLERILEYQKECC